MPQSDPSSSEPEPEPEPDRLGPDPAGAEAPRRRGYAGFIDRLNARLLPWIGPPPLGPYDEKPAATAAPACPLCGAPMTEHIVDRSAPRTQLHCPGRASVA